MTTYNLLPEFKMTQEEIEMYNSLPDNMPGNKLNKKQLDFVCEMYYKYITKNIDNQNWSEEMYKTEMREKWPSGPRVKSHEAKRFILGNLVYRQEKPVLTLEEAADTFLSCLTARPMYAKLISKVYKKG